MEGLVDRQYHFDPVPLKVSLAMVVMEMVMVASYLQGVVVKVEMPFQAGLDPFHLKA